ncbi:MAG: type I secretion system permease/ATPase [Rhodobacteraceae bacterium]|nr:type I secretion system permease/ATPase [Paracoccaceae bacterium]
MIYGNSSLRCVPDHPLWQNRGPLLCAGFFSVVVNVLMLTGSLFSIQIYDRVLPSHSRETLLALGLLTVFLFAMLFLMDVARAQIMARLAARVQSALDARLFDLILAQPAVVGIGSLRDLDAVQRAISAPVMLAAMDLPWVPFFFLALFSLHPAFGLLAAFGAGVLMMLSWLQTYCLSATMAETVTTTFAADRFIQQCLDADGSVQALGMQAGSAARWGHLRLRMQSLNLSLSDGTAITGAAGRVLRLILQSAMLATGAWLVIGGDVTVGAMFAASILTGRALAPIEGMIAGWPVARRGLMGWRALFAVLTREKAVSVCHTLEKPTGALEVQNLTVMAPGAVRPSVLSVSFSLNPGQMLGVVGPSGSGKSSLMRALCGLWPVSSGAIRFDGAERGQYAPAALARALGYLPQTMRILDGTIAENIARLDLAPESDAVMMAARAAGLHELILSLPQGYDTLLSPDASVLSGGQIQRIGLARALFGFPPILLLDEPETGLDADGQQTLLRALRTHRARGGTAILCTHRMQFLRDCDLILALDAGRCRAFGPREAVLAALPAGTSPGSAPLRLAGGAS